MDNCGLSIFLLAIIFACFCRHSICFILSGPSINHLRLTYTDNSAYNTNSDRIRSERNHIIKGKKDDDDTTSRTRIGNEANAADDDILHSIFLANAEERESELLKNSLIEESTLDESIVEVISNIYDKEKGKQPELSPLEKFNNLYQVSSLP